MKGRSNKISYIIYIDDKPIFKGKNLKKLIKEAKKKYPGKEISIGWEIPEGVLIA